MTLQLKDVSLKRGTETHIYPTDLALQQTHFNVLLGTTLSGKTSLMRLMAGLERPGSGSVWFDGKDITKHSVQDRDVAMVYQQFINYPNFTVFENIASPLRLKGVDKKTMHRTIEQVADLLKLTPMLDRNPSELSGGQQQRTALARALVKSARLVLLDEPLANLDYKLREELREELPRLFRNTGSTVVYATTEPSEALLLGGYTAALSEGRVVQFGPTSEVYRTPVNQQSAKVFSDPPINTTKVTKSDGVFSRDKTFTFPVPEDAAQLADGTYTLGIRPHHLTLELSGEYSIAVDAEVVLTEISGSESTVHALVEGESWISLSRGVHSLARGQKVTLYFDSRHCLLFDQSDRLVWS